MKIRVRVQRHLCIGFIDGDSGEWSFSLCRRGLEAMLGQRLKTGETYLVEITGKVLNEE